MESSNSEEKQYLDLIKYIIDHGKHKLDRTGVGTLSLFGSMMRFNLTNSFPLLTTKKIFWKGVVEELLWFLHGSTNCQELAKKGVNIWNANGTRDFLDKRGLQHYEENDLGPIYGFQWRHFGANYNRYDSDYTNQGIDQIRECIRLIKTDPLSRRIILTAWNPSDLHKMALPPCHIFAQFEVYDNQLSCIMYQRSCDMGLGVPFNIASYSLLTCLIAHSCGLNAKEFIYMMGDAHVYLSHIEPLKEQMTRNPRLFPQLEFLCEPKDIDFYTSTDFRIINYEPYPAIKMDMAV